jgi:hypothetical protein
METYGNIWKHLGNIRETFGRLFPYKIHHRGTEDTEK